MKDIKKNLEIIPFPDFNNAFNVINGNEKFIFLPLATIQFNEHPAFENRRFHFVSIWDTGTYEENYFNAFRKNIRCIKFKIENNKYSYLAEPKFPFINLLPKAYDLIESNFQENIDYYLKPKSSRQFSIEDKIFSDGKELVFNSLEDFDKPDAAYYFERITQYLYTRKKYELFDKINADFAYLETFAGLTTTTTKEKLIAEFNDEGKSKNEIINNLLEKPNWLQKPEEILDSLNLIFIGSVSESDFTNGSSEIYLFWDQENNEAYQFFQWT
jgi:hypothetical protein